MTPTWARTVAIAKIAFLLLIASAAAETNQATKLLELARARFGELLPAEEDLFRAVANGEAKDYSDYSGKYNDPAVADKWASDRVLRASRIVWLCTDPQAVALVTYHGLTVKAARIDEKIDLDFARFAFPLHFFSCAFTDNWSLRGAHLPFLDLSGSYLRGLQANWAQIECSVFLNNIKDQGEVSLVGATIGGDLACDGGQVINGGANALSCDGAKITGIVSLRNGFKAEGQVKLVGATIGGNLDCDGGIILNREGYAFSIEKANISGGVFLKNRFKAEGEVRLVGATIGANLDCDGAQIINGQGYALSCDGTKITGNVFLNNGFKAEGEVRLVGATIGGDLACNGGILSRGGGNALSCDGTKITGNVFLNNGFKAEGEVRLVGTTIGGDLACNGGILSRGGGNALSCNGTKITGGVFLNNGFKAEGEVELVGATIGGVLDCSGGQFLNCEGYPLLADNANITRGVFLKNPFRAEGEVSFKRATVSGDLDCSGGILRSRTGNALSCDGAKITGNVFLRNGFKAEGEVRFVGATIGGALGCDGGQLVNYKGNAFSADNANINGGVFLKNPFKAEGNISLARATIGGDLDCSGGALSRRAGNALFCDGTKITGNVFLGNSFKAEGEVRFVGATIGGNLDCVGGQLLNQRGNALSVDRANISGGVFLRNAFKAEGEVIFATANVSGYFYWENVTSPKFAALDLRSAKVGTLADDEKSWPDEGSVFLDGLTYERIDDNSPTDAATRLKWLKRQPRGHFLPQPFEQLATVLRTMGHDEDAKKVMIAKNENEAKYIPLRVNRIGDWLWFRFVGPIIGYGYRPWNAFGISLIVIVVGWIFFWIGDHFGLITPKDDKAFAKQKWKTFELEALLIPKFNPFIYSLETFVPFLKLEQSDYWLPNARLPNAECAGAWLCAYMWFHIIAGWVLTTLWIAGLTGLVKS